MKVDTLDTLRAGQQLALYFALAISLWDSRAMYLHVETHVESQRMEPHKLVGRGKAQERLMCAISLVEQPCPMLEGRLGGPLRPSRLLKLLGNSNGLSSAFSGPEMWHAPKDPRCARRRRNQVRRRSCRNNGARQTVRRRSLARILVVNTELPPRALSNHHISPHRIPADQSLCYFIPHSSLYSKWYVNRTCF